MEWIKWAEIALYGISILIAIYIRNDCNKLLNKLKGNWKMSIYQQIKNTGCAIDHHESDLYCENTIETTKIIEQYEFKGNVERFWNEIDEDYWYCIPFAYDPYWSKKNI